MSWQILLGIGGLLIGVAGIIVAIPNALLAWRKLRHPVEFEPYQPPLKDKLG